MNFVAAFSRDGGEAASMSLSNLGAGAAPAVVGKLAESGADGLFIALGSVKLGAGACASWQTLIHDKRSLPPRST
jgi:hypothetical protein